MLYEYGLCQNSYSRALYSTAPTIPQTGRPTAETCAYRRIFAVMWYMCKIHIIAMQSYYIIIPCFLTR
ncbi:hypothetical protein OBV_41060 [Oscillibacter valericigenes Sjm18-20]|nr:hypothetical protein OBV_41060 [Oscillibacter valericigenes Sjm18-20]